MTIDEIKKLIQVGEKTDVEFKESKNALTKDVFDTVCSFNNRNGGHILLGVNDKREIVGVSKDRVDKVIKEFTTAINNPQKMYPPLYLLPEVFDIDEKKVIYIIYIKQNCPFPTTVFTNTKSKRGGKYRLKRSHLP